MFIFLAFLAIFIGLNIRYSPIVFLSLGLLLIFLIWMKRKKKVALLLIGLISISFGVSFINFSFTRDEYSGMVIDAKDNYYLFSSKLEKLYVYDKEHKYEIGDFLTLEGEKSELSFTMLESDFDFKDYLNKKGVYSELKVNKETINFQNPIRVRNYKNNVLSHYDEDTQSLIKSLFNSGGGESEIRTNMNVLHLSRLLSASGIYLYLFLRIIKYLLPHKLKDKYKDLICIFLTSILLIFTFPKFAIIKIFTVSIFRWINDHLLKKKFSYLQILCGSAVLFLIFDYHLAYQDSFILGYSIPLFAYFVNNSLKIKGKIKKKAVLCFLTLLFLLPFETKYFNSVNILSYPLQLFFTPILMTYSFSSMLVLFSLPMYGFMNGFTWFVKATSDALKPFALSINIPQFNTLLLFLYEFLLAGSIYYYSIMFKPIFKYLVLISVTLMSLYVLPIKNSFTSEVCFINVGQGDSTLIRVKNQTILIDTGGSLYKDIADDVLIPYLRSKRIYNIDLLITTHDDFDHSGAAYLLCENFKVRNYVSSYKDFPIDVGNLRLENYNIYPELWKDDNDKSLVIGFNLFSKYFLIMGDAPIKIEKEIIKNNPNFNADVLKIGHHGSDTSTCKEFLDSISPKEAIVSVGKNYYGHPNKKVINLLNSKKIKIHRTDFEGTIVYSS